MVLQIDVGCPAAWPQLSKGKSGRHKVISEGLQQGPRAKTAPIEKLICQRWARHFQSPEASTGRHSIPPIRPYPHPPMLMRDAGETVAVNCAKLAVRGSLELTRYPATTPVVHSQVRKLKTKTLHGTKIQILLRATLHNLCFRYFHKVDRNAKLSTCQLGRNIQKCHTKTHIRAYPLAEQASSKEQMTHIQTPNTQMDSYGVKEHKVFQSSLNIRHKQWAGRTVGPAPTGVCKSEGKGEAQRGRACEAHTRPCTPPQHHKRKTIKKELESS